nr:MAG TPA_asm: hypothetical protein [Caudoviricetes sp.]
MSGRHEEHAWPSFILRIALRLGAGFRPMALIGWCPSRHPTSAMLMRVQSRAL